MIDATCPLTLSQFDSTRVPRSVRWVLRAPLPSFGSGFGSAAVGAAAAAAEGEEAAAALANAEDGWMEGAGEAMWVRWEEMGLKVVQVESCVSSAWLLFNAHWRQER